MCMLLNKSIMMTVVFPTDMLREISPLQMYTNYNKNATRGLRRIVFAEFSQRQNAYYSNDKYKY